jgi:ER-bound oxygenase mpaB/B'/Rubber oxygenase, catalytic domain
MEFFVDKESIVRKIWGKGDTILFVFAGAAAEFALNKAVDWLYFTGRLPSDPLGRLFSTVMYARKIVFSERQEALNAIDKITSIHAEVENNRNAKIPDWAYRDVLFMLIQYSIASFELLERKLTEPEKEDLFDVFFRMGERMKLKDLPRNYAEWETMRHKQLNEDLSKSHYTVDLYKQYRKHLGFIRYKILKESQKMVCPRLVCTLLGLGRILWVMPLLVIYKISRKVKLDGFLKAILLPKEYKEQINDLDRVPS